MERDDFSKPTIDVLAKRVGVRCSNPTCKKLTTGPRSDSSLIVNIGVAAHITAASPGGPRYDATITSEQRQSIENGIWLCQNCAKLIDNDPMRYTVELLQEWKQRAESAALMEIEGNTSNEPIETTTEIDLAYRIVKQRSEIHTYHLEISLTNRGTVPLGNFHIDLQMPAIVIKNPQDNMYFVPSRSTRDFAFFRLISERHCPTIKFFPGDTIIVMAIEYFMDHDIYFNRGDLFNKSVRVDFYHHGYRSITIEKKFGELQFF